MQHELRFVKKLEAYQSQLYVDLDLRSRALKNWKKLRLLILLMQVCGGRTAEPIANDPDYEEPVIRKSCREKIAPYILDPRNRYKVAWDVFMGDVYLLTYVMDPLIVAFLLKPLTEPSINTMTITLTIIILFNMLLTPIMGVMKDNDLIQLENERMEDGMLKVNVNDKLAMRRRVNQM